MTEHNEDPVADIAWMRRLAEEGAQAPMQGAPILMAAGLTFGSPPSSLGLPRRTPPLRRSMYRSHQTRRAGCDGPHRPGPATDQ